MMDSVTTKKKKQKGQKAQGRGGIEQKKILVLLLLRAYYGYYCTGIEQTLLHGGHTGHGKKGGEGRVRVRVINYVLYFRRSNYVVST